MSLGIEDEGSKKLSRPIKALILEDSEDDVILAQNLLAKAGLEIDWEHAATEAQFVAALQLDPDIILADWHLPTFSGKRALDLVRGRTPRIPLIILSGAIGEENAIDAVLEGASDYVLKDRPGRLPQAVRRALKQSELEHERDLATAQRKLFFRAVEQSPASVIIADVEGAIEYVNPKFERVTGYSASEVLGRNPRILKSGETTPHEYGHLWSVITSGKEWRGTFHNRRKDGTLFWERATISPIRDETGNTTHFIGIKEDITEQRQLEQRLLQVQKMESVGRLAGGIAHDFNNHLTVINGFCDLILHSLEPESSLHRQVTQIRKAGASAAQLTSQLLEFGRKQVVSAQPLDLSDVVQQTVPLLQQLIGEDIEVELQLSEALPGISGNTNQLEQVLMNLAANARDAMPSGGKVSITTKVWDVEEIPEFLERDYSPGRYVSLHFADNGEGMDEETLSHMFEPFFTTKRNGGGSGLGLATVYGIVRQMKGWVDVSSAPRQGTTFFIHFPAILSQTEHTAEDALGQPEISWGNKTGSILVVEDQDALRSLIVDVLERRGYDVRQASNGMDALELAKSLTSLDLLISDVVMPRMNGIDLARKLRELRPDIRCLLSSGYSPNQQALSAELRHGTRFLPKPYALTDLLNLVEQTLSGD